MAPATLTPRSEAPTPQPLRQGHLRTPHYAASSHTLFPQYCEAWALDRGRGHDRARVVVALCHNHLLQIQCQAAGQGCAVSEDLALQEVTIEEGQGTGAQNPGELSYGYPYDNITLMIRPSPLTQAHTAKRRASLMAFQEPTVDNRTCSIIRPLLLATEPLLREQPDYFG